MIIRMYECGFGDCFRLRGEDQVDLYVDFGIHGKSWPDKKVRFESIISDMAEESDFLLTHYHEDHFNGAIYMGHNTDYRFNEVYISNVWDMPESVDITSLTLLRGIFTRSVILGRNTIIDFLESICTRYSRIHFLSRGMKFHNNRYIVLWPERNYVAERARRIFQTLRSEINEEALERVERIANRLNALVVAMERDGERSDMAYMDQFGELREDYSEVQRIFDRLYGSIYDKSIQYKLTKFGNEISIVFQNDRNDQGDRKILFTGDFGKEGNWSFIECNRDRLVNMHPYYEVIKLPHHGTKSYYHSFVGRIDDASTLLIPNGYIKAKWYVDSKYKADFAAAKNKTICAYSEACVGISCPKGRCIYPNLYLDI